MSHSNLSMLDLAICAALERLALENARSAETARAANEKDDAKFFQRASNAYARALEEYRDYGVRPKALVSGGWHLPSRSDNQPHLLTMDGDWRCTCRAGDSMHWAKALIIGVEVASDDMDRFDSADEPTDDYLWSDGTPVPLEMPSWLRGETRIAA